MKAVLPSFITNCNATHGRALRRLRLRRGRAGTILHRAAVVVCAVALSGSLLLFGQRTGRPTSRLRALALLEVASNGHARLVPIAIKVGDKFYNADFYRADPRPMALDQGTVYEAARAGDSVGLFTVTNAQSIKGVWVGVGQWRPNNAPEPEKKKVESTPPPDDTDQPPILRKTPAHVEAKPTPPPSTGPESAPAAAGTEPAAPPKPLSATPPPAAPAPSNSSEDVERPILRRGKPATREAGDELPPAILAKPGAAHSTPGAASVRARNASAINVEVLTAISDAGGPSPRPYVMQLNPDERARYEATVRQIAYDAIRKFAAARPQHKPAAAGELSDVQLHVYDAHYNNEPDLVLTASLPELLPPGAKSDFRYSVTVVARVDMYGQTQALLAHVTDSAHLDAYPRLELIDVVDAEGSGSGQLLFRQVSDTGYSYVLYRIGMDKLWPLFEGAGQNF